MALRLDEGEELILNQNMPSPAPFSLLDKKPRRLVRKATMKFDFDSLTEDARYKLMLATVLPRPIAWVTSQDRNGVINAAPFSFFNAFGTEPATLAIGVGRHSPTQPKDTCLNIRATEEFVVNLVPFSAAERMRASSMPFPSQVSEVEAVGLSTMPSEKVGPPRISESPASFECKFMQ